MQHLNKQENHEIKTFYGNVSEAINIDNSIIYDQSIRFNGTNSAAKIAVAYCPKCGTTRRYLPQRNDSEKYCRDMAITQFRNVNLNCKTIRDQKMVNEIMQS
ncbi:MAG TPA: hypothetical protein VIE65_17360 [Methylobacter sp.]|jgi:hypothetical protein